MIYKFKSKAAGDLIMLGDVGDKVLRLIGKEPADKGIIEPATIPAAIDVIEKAMADEEAQRKLAELEAAAEGRAVQWDDTVTLQQHLWPLKEMLRRALAEKQEIVWGV